MFFACLLSSCHFVKQHFFTKNTHWVPIMGILTSGLIKIRVALLVVWWVFFLMVALCVVEKKNKTENLALLQIAQGAANSTNDFSDIWNEIRENKEVCLQKTPRA